MRRNAFFALAIQLIFGTANAQTTAGIGTTIVFPVDAQTVSFASEMTLFNPGPSLLTASVKFYEANNSGAADRGKGREDRGGGTQDPSAGETRGSP